MKKTEPAVNTYSSYSKSEPVLHDRSPDYFSVPLESLQIDTITGFDIYLKISEYKKYVLFRGGDVHFREEHKERLQQNKVADIYIKSADRRQYVRYLENHLHHIITDLRLSATQKSKIVYECAVEVVQEVYEKPWMSDGIKRTQRLVTNTVEHLCQNAGALAGMISIMSNDYYTYNHCTNISVYGVALARRLGFNVSQLNELGTGLLLHDIGKIQIDHGILNKKGPLTNEEYLIIQKHPNLGADMLLQSQQVLPEAIQVVRQHHEKCSGTGYPERLQGIEIHPFAKIASLVDVFDALTTNRPYKDALGAFAALELMQKEMKGSFSPNLYREMVWMLRL